MADFSAMVDLYITLSASMSMVHQPPSRRQQTIYFPNLTWVYPRSKPIRE